MKIYCIGIGGIGLSALARYYKYQGHEVSGSDSSDSELIQKLIQEGIPVTVGVDESNITQDTDMVVYTIAIPDTQPEFVRARTLGLVTKTYPEALGEVTKSKKTIAVCGTHGKTTTTAMAYHALKACGINPTVIIGSLLAGVGTNFIPGDSDYMIVEACEYKRSFLNLHPTHVIVTNVDRDHLDYYKDIHDISDAFQSFAGKIPSDGYLVTHEDVHLTTVGTHIHADSVDNESIELTVLGKHNRSNAQLVIALSRALELDEATVRAGLKEFKGTWRRLEYKGKTGNNVDVYDDYGHHPTELRATFEALREKYGTEYGLHVFFQPHLYSRTKLFLSEFADVLATVEYVHLMPIYAAREENDGTMSSSVLADEIRARGGRVELLETTLALAPSVEALQDEHIVAINIGAGDAYAELNKIFFL